MDIRTLIHRHASTKTTSLFTAGFLIATAVVIFLTAQRVIRTHQTPGPFKHEAQGFCDFQNGVYFPSLAFRQGVSPYSQQYADDYPVPRSTPFYWPTVFALHVPFAALPLSISEPIYFGWMIILVLLLAGLVAKWTCSRESNGDTGLNIFRWPLFAMLALGIVVGRGGQQTLYTGYFTFEIILATLLAVQYAQKRPWLSGISLAIVACKPNYLLPLGLMMLARGNWKALIIGAILTLLIGGACIAWILPDGGLPEIIQQIQQTQEIHKADPIERPVNSWIRVDWPAIMAKWLEWDPNEREYLICMFLMVVPTCVVLWRAGSRSPKHSASAVSTSVALMLVTTLSSVYHHAYDSVLILPVVAALVVSFLRVDKDQFTASLPGDELARMSLIRLPAMMRLILLGLLLLPWENYLSSQSLLQRLNIQGAMYQAVTSLNGIALFLAWILLIVQLALDRKRVGAFEKLQSSKAA